MVLIAVLLICIALVTFGIAVTFPWWQYREAAFPVVMCILALCFVVAPISFILGFAGFGSVAAALKEDVQSLQLCLPVWKLQQ